MTIIKTKKRSSPQNLRKNASCSRILGWWSVFWGSQASNCTPVAPSLLPSLGGTVLIWGGTAPECPPWRRAWGSAIARANEVGGTSQKWSGTKISIQSTLDLTDLDLTDFGFYRSVSIDCCTCNCYKRKSIADETRNLATLSQRHNDSPFTCIVISYVSSWGAHNRNRVRNTALSFNGLFPTTDCRWSAFVR